MRKLPIFFLIDVSESMVGNTIEQVQRGMNDIIQNLRGDPYALETAHVEVIVYAGRPKTVTAMEEVYKFYPPQLPIGGGTSLGKALNHLMDRMDTVVVKTTADVKGDWKPIVFLFTDGTPTDNPQSAIARWNKHYRSKANMVVVSFGDNINPLLFGQLTGDIVRFNDHGDNSYKAFFKWVTASIQATSRSIGAGSDDNMHLGRVDGINLEKVNPEETRNVDDNFAVLMAKCLKTDKRYLIKYQRSQSQNEYRREFRFIGAYTIDETMYNELTDGKSIGGQVNTEELVGRPVCPCCGNEYGMVTCDCGGIFCVGADGAATCPWCGMKGHLSIVESGIDIGRTCG